MSRRRTIFFMGGSMSRMWRCSRLGASVSVNRGTGMGIGSGYCTSSGVSKCMSRVRCTNRGTSGCSIGGRDSG